MQFMKGQSNLQKIYLKNIFNLKGEEYVSGTKGY